MSRGQRLPKLLSVRAVADQTTLPVSTVYDAVYRGELPVVRIGRSVRIDERDLVDFIAARREPRRSEPSAAPSPFTGRPERAAADRTRRHRRA